MDDLFKVSLGSLLLLTLTFAAEERKPSTEPTAVFVTPSYEPRTSTTKRPTVSPLRFTFPPPRRDQQRSQTRQKIYEDTNQVQNIPATYESIVYNPDSKEATSIFSRSNFWDTPELVIQESNQRQQGKNSYVTKTSRTEYTPNYRSIQTPLEKIQYQRPNPVHEEQTEDGEEVEEESQKNEETEEHLEEEYPEEVEEELVDEDPKPTYSTNLQNQKFESFESPDFYGDVLNNIGSIFSEEDNKNNVKSLLPQFEEHSYENLQKGENFDEDNEELEEYDQVEDEESKAVTQPPVKPAPVQPILKQSPFPSVRILTNSSQIEKPRQQKTFSPWLPVNNIKQEKPGNFKFSPWLPTQQTVINPVKTWPVPSTAQSIIKPRKTWPVISTAQPVKAWTRVSTEKPREKYSAKRPKKNANRRVDSPEVFVTPVPTADQGGEETNIAQTIDDLYSNQHKQV